jgi:hypothetical protein
MGLAGTSRLSVRVQGQSGVVCLSYQGQTAFVWTIKENDVTVHPRSERENKVCIVGFPALTSSRSEKPD